METSAKNGNGDDLLTLSNVVHNEAATSNDMAKKVVAYAYMNRIGSSNSDKVREPVGKEISHYSKLLNRWKSFASDEAKLTFLRLFGKSFKAAEDRYFPNWAGDLNYAKKHPQFFYMDKFKEITIKGVPRKDFIFYKGVR